MLPDLCLKMATERGRTDGEAGEGGEHFSPPRVSLTICPWLLVPTMAVCGHTPTQASVLRSRMEELSQKVTNGQLLLCDLRVPT